MHSLSSSSNLLVRNKFFEMFNICNKNKNRILVQLMSITICRFYWVRVTPNMAVIGWLVELVAERHVQQF